MKEAQRIFIHLCWQICRLVYSTMSLSHPYRTLKDCQFLLALFSKIPVRVNINTTIYVQNIFNDSVSFIYNFQTLGNKSDDKHNLRIEGVGPDIVNISWNGEEYLRNGVHQIRLVAYPSETPLPVAIALVNSSDSKGSITTNLVPSTRYMIYIVEDSNWDKYRVIQYITTEKGGNVSSDKCTL